MKFQFSPALQASNLAAGFERSNQILLILVAEPQCSRFPYGLRHCAARARLLPQPARERPAAGEDGAIQLDLQPFVPGPVRLRGVQRPEVFTGITR